MRETLKRWWCLIFHVGHTRVLKSELVEGQIDVRRYFYVCNQCFAKHYFWE